MMYDQDEHLDTSWCPVCDRMILPKRYQIPIDPPVLAPQPQPSPSATSVRQSQTTRGKHGTIKARNGAGRARPSLQRTNSAKSKSVVPPPQEPPAPPRMRTVIDQAQTPLYCSEQCRQADLDLSWYAAPPPARIALEDDSFDPEQHRSSIRLGGHPAQLNPARASPPPPSPVLPPVPPNSWRAPGVRTKDLVSAFSTLDLSRIISEQDEDFVSDISSADTTPSPDEVKPKAILSHINDVPSPPPIPPMLPHPHGNLAPVRPPPSAGDDDPKPSNDGFFSNARLLSRFFSSDEVTEEQARAKKAARIAREQKEDEAIARTEAFLGRKEPYTEKQKREQERRKLDREEEEMAKLRNKENFQRLLSGSAFPPRGTLLTPTIPGISTHRRRSDIGGPPPPERIAATIVAMSRAQSAQELNDKPPSSFALSFRTKSSASVATSSEQVYGINSLGTSPSSLPSPSSLTDRPKPKRAPAVKNDPPRTRSIAAGLEGKLLFPDVLLRPPPVRNSSAIQRTQSDSNVASNSKRGGRRPSSTLGPVREEEGGVWHRPDDERSETSTSRSSETSTSTDLRCRSRRVEKEKKRGHKARSTLSETRSTSTAPSDTYRVYTGPLFDIIPNIPVRQRRREHLFVPDENEFEHDDASNPAPPTSSTGTAVNIPKGEYLIVSEIHKRDVETARRPIREVSRRRGTHNDRSGWWIEKEWEVTAIPERKKLFNLDGGN